MDLSNNVDFSIAQFDEKHYIYGNINMFEGINGVIPGLEIETNSFNDDVSDDEVDVKLTVGGEVKINTKGFIYERYQDADAGLKAKIHLVPKDLIYVRRSVSYDDLDSIVSDLWKGKKESIPSGGQMKANQMMRMNSDFLTDAILCLKSNFAFAYEMNNTLRGIDLSKTSPDVTIEIGDEYTIIDKGINAKYNPLEDTEIKANDLTGCGVVVSNLARFVMSEATNYYNNYASNRALFNRHNETIQISYLNYGAIRIGDLVEVAVTPNLKKKYRCVFTWIKYVNRQYHVISTLSLINEG